MAGAALFISLGGTSYAVTKLPKNSVASPQVKDGSLTAKDLRKGVLTSGPQGPAGARGPRGAEGPAGAPGGLPTVRIANTWNDAKPMGPNIGGGQWIKLLSIPNLPAGAYRVDFVGSAVAAGTGSGRMEIFCSTYAARLDQPEAQATRTTITGTILAPGVDQVDRRQVSDFVTFKRDEPFNLWVTCTSNLTAPQVTMIHSKLTATPIGGYVETAQ